MNPGNDPRLAVLRELLATGKPAKVRKAVEELVLIPDDGTALALAAQTVRICAGPADSVTCPP